MELISYGSISKNFSDIAKLSNFFKKIKNKDIKQTRLDCYELNLDLHPILNRKWNDCNMKLVFNIEIFYPSQNYPDHTDNGGISYFIPLEEGIFTISNVNYPIVPFVLYSFEDSKLHNTNFGAIMLK